MISYLYYDTEGILREFITAPSRRTDGSNFIYMYFERTGSSSVSEQTTDTQGTTIPTVITDFRITSQIPYDEQRTLKYFKYNTDYLFYYKAYQSNELAVAGVHYMTPTLYINGVAYVQGTYPFMVEDNNIILDDTMTYGMYYYLLNQIKGGFDTASASANTLAEGSSATASVSFTEVGVIKSLDFVFGIPRGNTGVQGPIGNTGQRGSRWFVGSGAPSSSGTGYFANDMYLDDTNYIVYSLSSVSGTSLTWAQQGASMKAPVISSIHIQEV